jgi:DNA polymerase-3 subunit delta
VAVLTETELRKQLSEDKLERLYIIYGAEKLMVRRLAQRLIKKAGGDVFPEFNCNLFGSESTVDAIADAAEALPFMAERKCVSVEDAPLGQWDKTEQNKLWELLDNLPETSTIVFWFPTAEYTGKDTAWKNLLKKGEKAGAVVECKPKDAADLRKLLMREAEKAGCTLSRDVASQIIEYAGTDLRKLLGEVEKLTAYCGEGEITRQMVEDLVPKTTETTVFYMARALTSGNYEKAYRMMDQLFYQNEEPIAVLGALSSVYVDMYRVKAALESGKTFEAPMEYGNYKGMAFKLKNAQSAARSLTAEQLRQCLHLLLEADLQLKGSRLDPRIVLDRLIAGLLLAAKGERNRG